MLWGFPGDVSWREAADTVGAAGAGGRGGCDGVHVEALTASENSTGRCFVQQQPMSPGTDKNEVAPLNEPG